MSEVEIVEDSFSCNAGFKLLIPVITKRSLKIANKIEGFIKIKYNIIPQNNYRFAAIDTTTCKMVSGIPCKFILVCVDELTDTVRKDAIRQKRRLERLLKGDLPDCGFGGHVLLFFSDGEFIQ